MQLDTLSTVFVVGSFLLLPFYVLMVIFPNTSITRRVMRSIWSVVAPSVLLVGFGVAFLLSDHSILLRFGELLFSAAGNSAFKQYLQILNEQPPAALVMWLHAIAADLVMARWAYLESQELKLKVLPTSLAILLMGTNGPLGFLVYVMVRQITGWQRARAV
jgi:hypothetical protein